MSDYRYRVHFQYRQWIGKPDPSGVTMVATEIPQRTDASGQSAWSREASHWHVMLTCNGRSEAWEYSQGSAHRRERQRYKRIGEAAPPCVADVVSCLVSEAQSGDQTFEDFASDMGLDTDSRRAHKTWLACVDTRIRLRNLLGEALDAIVDASEDY